MTTLVKAFIGLIAAGGSAGLGIGSYYLMKPKTLMEKFKKEGLEVLDYKKGDDQAWSDKFKKHKEESETNNKFESVSEEESEGLPKLKDKCKEYLEQTPEEIGKTEGLENKVKKWCTKDKTQK